MQTEEQFNALHNTVQNCEKQWKIVQSNEKQSNTVEIISFNLVKAVESSQGQVINSDRSAKQ